MKISEKDRLDLRQELERIFSNKRFAEIAMEAMPPIDYDQLATKSDLRTLSQELRGEMAELRGNMAELRGDMAELRGDMAGLRGDMAGLRGEMKADLANTTRLLVASQLVTMVMLGGWVTAVT